MILGPNCSRLQPAARVAWSGDDELLTCDEAARLLKVRPTTVRAWFHREPKLPRVKVGTGTRVRLSDLLARLMVSGVSPVDERLLSAEAAQNFECQARAVLAGPMTSPTLESLASATIALLIDRAARIEAADKGRIL